MLRLRLADETALANLEVQPVIDARWPGHQCAPELLLWVIPGHSTQSPQRPIPRVELPS